MSLPSPATSEEISPAASSLEAADPLGTGLPAAWWPSVSAAASVVFSVFWIMESWERAGPLRGPAKINQLMQGLGALLATLVCSYAVHRFWKHRHETLGLALSLAVAAGAMALHHL
ncbi:hypothetical protein [Microvirga yunnanensis]|uniref:hypothetical protein n=1 Tax=Microvirga yunnanensis TaxID=2953740 RepID=UPI0021C72ADB|nr:hypothetical protein [Microvirga sp. HBU65207]